MQLLNNYLKEIKRHLPKEQREDIINELADNLRSQLEDREASLGRPLTEVETQEFLRDFGHPMVVAGRYCQEQGRLAFGREWIGPVLFPFYARVLKFNLGITLPIVVVVAAIVRRSQPGESIAWAILFPLLIQFAIVTLIFCGIQGSLPRVQWVSTKGAPRISRLESIAQIIALGVCYAGLQVLRVWHPFDALAFHLAPVWHWCYLAALFTGLLSMLQAIVNLFHPEWLRLRLMTKVIEAAAGIVLLGVLLNAGMWLVPNANLTADDQRSLDTLNRVIFYSLLACGVPVLWIMLLDLRKLLRKEAKQISCSHTIQTVH